jgi:hypothetical protein
MTDIRSLERTLLDNLPWNKASIKFLARFFLALYDMWTVNREASGRVRRRHCCHRRVGGGHYCPLPP